MVKKPQSSKSDAKTSKSTLPLAGSAQQIWQASLGAIAKAQAEGTKALESLVKEGTSIQRKTQAAAEEKIAEATNRMSAVADGITSKASGHWDKLETIFEDRVAKALNKLGVPSAKDVNALIARIDELNKSVQKLSAKDAAASKVPAPKAAAKPVAKPRKAKSTTSMALAAALPLTVTTESATAKAKPAAKAPAKRARKVTPVTTS